MVTALGPLEVAAAVTVTLITIYQCTHHTHRDIALRVQLGLNRISRL